MNFLYIYFLMLKIILKNNLIDLKFIIYLHWKENKENASKQENQRENHIDLQWPRIVSRRLRNPEFWGQIILTYYFLFLYKFLNKNRANFKNILKN
jgi:hypothetical protein